MCPSDHSYTLRVVGSGIKAQSSNPEVKVKIVDPVVNQIIDKLRHINQVSCNPSLSRDPTPPGGSFLTRFGSFQTCLRLGMIRLAVSSSLTAAAAAAFACLLRRCPREQAEGQVTPPLTSCWHPFPDQFSPSVGCQNRYICWITRSKSSGSAAAACSSPVPRHR